MVNDKMYKISVILPAYNAENTIHHTINSIINQTIGFENIELILIDDYSSDNTKYIIQEYSNKYENIKAFFLDENTGSPSIPRNIGIKNSTAPYLIFIDNDDELFDDYCEILYNTIINNDVDIVNCNSTNKLINKTYIPKTIDKISYDKKIFKSDEKLSLKLTAWANIFNSTLIKENNIKFPNTLYEDGVFCLECLLKTNKPVIQLPKYPGYVYFIENEDSITRNVNLNTLKGFFEGYDLCRTLLKKNNLQYVEETLFKDFITMALLILFKVEKLDAGIKELYDYEKTLNFDISLNSKLFNLINQKIINKKFLQAKLIIKSIRLFYNKKEIRNPLFILYANQKELIR